LRHTAGNVPAEGTLSVISVSMAETDPAAAVKATVNAGCNPARVLTEGDIVWVTASSSNALLAFSASALLQNPSHALLADVSIGPAPAGMTLITGDRLVIADSDETSKPPGSGNLAVVSMSSALAGKPAVLGVIPVDGQPYQLIQTEQNSTLLVTNQSTGQLLALKIADLP
jgi:DNA-binding beta-propeller fold protein YncE